jgi:endonuclease/exonuclease/phosphatase family metal-dependent hydrolase
MPERSYGNALLSRWPIIASAAHHLTPVEGKEQRGLLEGRILLPTGQNFTVYVTHLDYHDDEGRLIQWRAVRSWTNRDRNRPHVLMGDFNAIDGWDHAGEPERLARMAEDPVSRRQLGTPEGSKLLSQIERAGYVDSMKLRGEPGHGTVPPSADPMRIDYIWLSKPLAPALKTIQVIYENPGEEASDHRPVWADLDLSALEGMDG